MPVLASHSSGPDSSHPPPADQLEDGDRIEISFDMPLQLEAIDPQHPNTAALLNGPLTLFAIGNLAAKMTRAQLLAACQSARGSSDWVVKTESGQITLKTFPAIRDEKYRLYHEVSA